MTTDTKDLTDADRFTAPVEEGDITPEHRAWMDAQIETTLAKKASGEMGYHSLDDVMREFGFDAR